MYPFSMGFIESLIIISDLLTISASQLVDVEPVRSRCQATDLSPHVDWAFGTGLGHDDVSSDRRVGRAARDTHECYGGSFLCLIASVDALLSGV